MEIERKYLVKELLDNLDAYPHVEIEQGYLCTSPTLRIRRMGDAYILTVKEKRVDCEQCVVDSTRGQMPPTKLPIVNREEEFALPAHTYIRLKEKCDGNMVSKTRYRIPVGEYTAELDIFHGIHSGLILVEVEFPSVEAANTFMPPDWFGEDVSDDPHYRNAYLAHSTK